MCDFEQGNSRLRASLREAQLAFQPPPLPQLEGVSAHLDLAKPSCSSGPLPFFLYLACSFPVSKGLILSSLMSLLKHIIAGEVLSD